MNPTKRTKAKKREKEQATQEKKQVRKSPQAEEAFDDGALLPLAHLRHPGPGFYFQTAVRTSFIPQATWELTYVQFNRLLGTHADGGAAARRSSGGSTPRRAWGRIGEPFQNVQCLVELQL